MGNFLREYKMEDSEELSDLISNIDTGYEVDELSVIEKKADSFIVYEDEVLKGFAYVMISEQDIEIRGDIKIFVGSEWRRHGIGTALYQELVKCLDTEKLDVLTAYIRVERMNPEAFCKQLGFEKWWGSPNLYYRGTGFPEVNLEFVKYDDRFFNQYVKVVQDCYDWISKSNDIKPLASEESVKNYQLKNKDALYLALDNDRIMASVTIGDGEIDNLMVAPAYQGQGLGKKTLTFGMNKLLNQGYEEIQICYMENNTVAENLYYSVGFQFLQNTHVYRKWI